MQSLHRTKNIGIGSFLLLLIVLSFSNISPGKSAVGMEGETTIYVNKSFQFSIIGLNESQYYVAVFTNHSATLSNETFYSSGFRYKFDRLIPADTDNIMFMEIYQSDSSGLNTSSLLYTRQFNLVTGEDLNYLQFILDNLDFAIPILIIAVFTGIFIVEANKRRTK